VHIAVRAVVLLSPAMPPSLRLQFASLLHYHVEPVFMYADMTGRDLLQVRE
jgi:hypothetical protein